MENGLLVLLNMMSYKGESPYKSLDVLHLNLGIAFPV